METTFFKQETDVSDEWVSYIYDEALKESQNNDSEIEKYTDREIDTEQMIAFLSGPAFDEYEDLEDDDKALLLTYDENTSLFKTPGFLRFRFNKLKKKVRKVFCEVTGALQEDEDISVKDIIKSVLIALIPAFAAGFPALIFPILIGIVAMFLKKGYNKVCSV